MTDKKTYEELEKRIRELEEQLKGGGNREYKSRLFGFIFGGKRTNTGRCLYITPFTVHPMTTCPALPLIQSRKWFTWA